MAKADSGWLDALRRRHYPPDRNTVPAHLTLFRSLPPSAEEEVRRRLSRASEAVAPDAQVTAPMDLDSGVALRVYSPRLDQIREELAEEFHGLLTTQDLGRWTAHVTIQNKVGPTVARALLRDMAATFEPRPLEITGLELVRYAGGGWDPVASYRFRGPRSGRQYRRS